MRVTGVPSLWDNDENESEKGNEAGKVRERPRGVLVTERDLTVLRWISEQFAVRADVTTSSSTPAEALMATGGAISSDAPCSEAISHRCRSAADRRALKCS